MERLSPWFLWKGRLMRCGAAFSTFDEEAAGVAEFRTVKVSTAATRQWFGGYLSVVLVVVVCGWWWITYERGGDG
jgi:hypothetical protein